MNVKICTSLEQSKKLVELGLDPKTADMHHFLGDNNPKTEVGFNIENVRIYSNTKYFYIPAWSLSALLELMPEVGYHEGGMHKDSYKGWNLDQFRLRYDAKVTLADFDRHGIYDYVDIVFKCIVWLIENGKIDPKNITI